MEELGPQFEKQPSGHKLKVEYGSTGPLKAQIEKGQPFDVADPRRRRPSALTLIKRGKLAAGIPHRRSPARAWASRNPQGRGQSPRPRHDGEGPSSRRCSRSHTIAFSDGGSESGISHPAPHGRARSGMASASAERVRSPRSARSQAQELLLKARRCCSEGGRLAFASVDGQHAEVETSHRPRRRMVARQAEIG